MEARLDLEPEQRRLDIIEKATRQFYAVAHAAGVTYEEMAAATGLPASTFSMWLRGYRPVTKLSVLQALIDGAPEVEAQALLA